MEVERLTRYQLLAAEIFSYSFANYADHLGIGNIRYDKLMPQDAKTLETAVREDWSIAQVAKKLEVDTDNAAALLESTREALQVVDAENPAESFRHAVRQLIKRAATEGLKDDDAVERLVVQVCYRVSDLAYLLEVEGSSLSRYSGRLRREPDEEYIDDEFEDDEFENDD